MPSWPKKLRLHQSLLMPPKQTTEFAPAKVNLTLHVTGQRDDGYHLLDSLVVFCGIGDSVSARAATTLGLTITGPQAELLPVGGDNMVLRAARALDPDRGAALTLHKQLPVASGIGGGSADAAATLRTLSRLWGVALPGAGEVLALGADVPVCLAGRPARMRGIGDVLEPVPDLPQVHIVLVNPRVEVPTHAVFAALETKQHSAMPDRLPNWRDAPTFAKWLSTQRNDLEAPARTYAPVIGVVLESIAGQPGALLARMSGSGATCFGLFATGAEAAAAADALGRAQPGWWVAAGAVRA
jgi:4-diphosphocytidyl-2-C-methyl-D-erythritol kinase